MFTVDVKQQYNNIQFSHPMRPDTFAAGNVLIEGSLLAGRPRYCHLPSTIGPLRKRWSGGAMVLGKLPVPGRPTIWIIVGQGPTALALDAGGVVLIFYLSSIISLF